jgi:hypothetical protein
MSANQECSKRLADVMTEYYLLSEYVVKGRHLNEVPLEKLAEKWLTTLVDVADDPGDMLAQARLNDLVSEFDLRCSTSPPYYRIGRGTYIRTVDDALEALRKEHPEVYAAAQHKQRIYASKLRLARDDADAQQGHPPPRETWQPLHQVSQRVVEQAEARRRNRISSPSIVPSDDPDDCYCHPTSPPDDREG